MQKSGFLVDKEGYKKTRFMARLDLRDLGNLCIPNRNKEDKVCLFRYKIMACLHRKTSQTKD